MEQSSVFNTLAEAFYPEEYEKVKQRKKKRQQRREHKKNKDQRVKSN